jgi:uncharacterized RDD family membrane protein YckC
MIAGTASQEGTRRVRVAGLGVRSLAAAADLAVLAPVLGACGEALRLALPMPPDAESETASWLLEMLIERNPMVLAAAAFAIAVTLAYVGVFTALCGRTLGQRLLDLQVIDEQGEPPRLPAVCMRTAALPVGLFFVGLGVLWIAFDREARGFHDHVAGTFVIRRARAVAASGVAADPAAGEAHR